MQNPIHDPDFYRRIVDLSEDGVWLINEKSETTYTNKRMGEILGYAADEMLGKDMFYFMTEENKELARKNMARRSTGVHENHDFVFQKKNGKKVWTNIAASPIFDPEGKFVGALGMISDISARRKSEIILTAQKNIFQQLNAGHSLESSLNELTNAIDFIINGVQSSILLLDDKGKYLLKGSAPKLPEAYSSAIHGAPIGPKNGSCGTSAFQKKLVVVTDVLSDPLWEDYRVLAKIHEFRACWSSPIISSKEQKVLGTFAMYFKTVRSPDEEEIQLIKEITASAALCIEHHQIERNLARSRDNARFLAEARKMLSSTLDYEEVLKGIPAKIVSHFADWCCVGLVSQDGKFKGISAFSDLPKVELTKKLERYTPDMDAPEGLPRAIREKKTLIFADLTEKDLTVTESGWARVGSRDPDVLASAIKAGLDSYMAVPMIFRDQVLGGLIVASCNKLRNYTQQDLEVITELANSCAQAIEHAKLYQRSQDAVIARDVFISIASHEFKTPLTVLRGRVDLMKILLEQNTLPASVLNLLKPSVDSLSNQTEKITHLVESLLDISRVSTNQLILSRSDTDLTHLVLETVHKMKPVYDKNNCPLVCEIVQNVTGYWDALRIEQVLNNLLTNALKFGDGKEVKVKVTASATHAFISVQDHGIGVLPEDQERIFERFERANSEKNFSGLGLGLYISRQIVQAHGGHIILKSKPGEGSTFRVDLPLKPVNV